MSIREPQPPETTEIESDEVAQIGHLSGESLAVDLARVGVLDPFETLAIIAPLCQTLQELHDAELTRSNLAPQNLRITSDGKVHLMDIPAETDPALVTPEQRARAPQDWRTDLWHLGVLASELLLGERVQTPSAIPPPPRLDPGLGEVLHRLLAPEPTDRFGSAREAAEAFGSAVRQVRAQRYIALDLEGTLLTTAFDPLPRPYLREFTDWCLETFDRVFIYTAVQERVARVIIARFVRAGVLPPAFPQQTEVVIWPRGQKGIRKDLRHLRVPLHWIVLLDDMRQWVVDDQVHRWVKIPAFDKPIDGDQELRTIRPEILARFK